MGDRVRPGGWRRVSCDAAGQRMRAGPHAPPGSPRSGTAPSTRPRSSWPPTWWREPSRPRTDGGAPPLRPGRRRPPVGLRHGRHGPGAPPHLWAHLRRRRVARGPPTRVTVPDGDDGRGCHHSACRPGLAGGAACPRAPADATARAGAGRGARAGTRDPGRGARPRAPHLRGVNASTVYRTLDLLEELGLVRHAHLGTARRPTTRRPTTTTSTRLPRIGAVTGCRGDGRRARNRCRPPGVETRRGSPHRLRPGASAARPPRAHA